MEQYTFRIHYFWAEEDAELYDEFKTIRELLDFVMIHANDAEMYQRVITVTASKDYANDKGKVIESHFSFFFTPTKRLTNFWKKAYKEG